MIMFVRYRAKSYHNIENSSSKCTYQTLYNNVR
nr:hypothetical protein IXTSGTPV_IXTSGTPV_CDS_0005 [Microvirus sp.]